MWISLSSSQQPKVFLTPPRLTAPLRLILHRSCNCPIEQIKDRRRDPQRDIGKWLGSSATKLAAFLRQPSKVFGNQARSEFSPHAAFWGGYVKTGGGVYAPPSGPCDLPVDSVPD